MPKKNEKRLEAILKAKEALGSIEAAKQASNIYKDFVSLRIAGAYILAKREQKGDTSKSIPDKEVDKKMLGLIKGGKSIFTSRGKERYAFAERLIGHAMNLEKAIKESQKSKEQKEAQKAKMKDVQNKEMKENVVTDVKPKVQPKETKKQETQKLQKEEMEMDDVWEL